MDKNELESIPTFGPDGGFSLYCGCIADYVNVSERPNIKAFVPQFRVECGKGDKCDQGAL